MTNQNNLIKYLKAQFRTVELSLPKVAHRPSDKAVHELRVATRRARVALWVLEQSSSPLRFKKLGHDFRKLGQTLGQVRELEVAIQDANHFGIEFFDLKNRHKKAQRRIQNLISTKKIENFSKQFADAETRIKNIGPISFSIVKSELIIKIRRQLKLSLRGETEPHKLRIVLKKTRYALEAMGKPVQKMKLLQNVLGDEHDLVTLQTYVGKSAKIKRKQKFFHDQATPLIKPALRFAMAQLNNV